jgi:hypothetical protein
MSDVTINDTPLVTVVTSIVREQLVLTVDGIAIGTVFDNFHTRLGPPPNMVLFVRNLPTGQQVSAQWRPSSGGAWVQFTDVTGGVQAQFPLPAPGPNPTSFDFVVEVEDTSYRHDPKLVLKVLVGDTEAGTG